MEKVRKVTTYKGYFEDFFGKQSRKVQEKIAKILSLIESVERIPTMYLNYMEGTAGLFEIRVSLGSDIFRLFCFFDDGKLVVLLSGFQKKTQRTPKREIDRAVRLMAEYYAEKKEEGKKWSSNH